VYGRTGLRPRGGIGGGEGSQIGPAHRLGAGLDGLFEFTAGALDHRPAEGIDYGHRMGLGDRAYGSWQDMLAGEKAREDRIDLVTVATPNSTHFEITKAFLEAGFHVSAQFADCGIHAMHMASFVTGQEVTKLSADNVSCLEQRVLEDDAMVNFRMDGGAVGRLWTSSIAIGRQHGLGIQVFGETGGLRWSQEQPNQLFYMPLNQRLQIIERGEANLSPEADRTTRVTIGHAEGMPNAL